MKGTCSLLSLKILEASPLQEKQWYLLIKRDFHRMHPKALLEILIHHIFFLYLPWILISIWEVPGRPTIFFMVQRTFGGTFGPITHFFVSVCWMLNYYKNRNSRNLSLGFRITLTTTNLSKNIFAWLWN